MENVTWLVPRKFPQSPPKYHSNKTQLDKNRESISPVNSTYTFPPTHAKKIKTMLPILSYPFCGLPPSSTGSTGLGRHWTKHKSLLWKAPPDPWEKREAMWPYSLPFLIRPEIKTPDPRLARFKIPSCEFEIGIQRHLISIWNWLYW